MHGYLYSFSTDFRGKKTILVAAVEKKIKSYSIRMTFKGPNVITVSQYYFFSHKNFISLFDAACFMPKTATISCYWLVFHPPFCPPNEIT